MFLSVKCSLVRSVPQPQKICEYLPYFVSYGVFHRTLGRAYQAYWGMVIEGCMLCYWSKSYTTSMGLETREFYYRLSRFFHSLIHKMTLLTFVAKYLLIIWMKSNFLSKSELWTRHILYTNCNFVKKRYLHAPTVNYILRWGEY